MSEHLLVGGLVVALFVTNVWWWRHTRTVRDALTGSRERDRRVAERARPADADSGDPGIEASRTAQTTLAEAATRADCPADEVPDRIEQFRERIADLERETDRLRTRWAESWFALLDTQSLSRNGPHVVCVELDDGTTATAQTFADVAQRSRYDVVVVAAYADGAVTVTVDESLHDQVTAAGIVDDIVAAAGGNGGGSTAYATGGGCDPDRLTEAVQETVDRLETELKTGSVP